MPTTTTPAYRPDPLTPRQRYECPGCGSVIMVRALPDTADRWSAPAAWCRPCGGSAAPGHPLEKVTADLTAAIQAALDSAASSAEVDAIRAAVASTLEANR